MHRLLPFLKKQPLSPREQLVRLVARESDLHRLITQVAAGSRLLEEATKLYQAEGGAESKAEGQLNRLCKTHRITTEYFYKRLHVLVRILNLVQHEETYYDVLGVPRTATQSEIKHAFRRLSLTVHPDRNPNDPQAAEHFRTLHQAYQILANEKLRQRYDLHMTESRWDEKPAPFQEPDRVPRAGNRNRYLWLMGILLLVLLASSLLIDFPSLQGERYYQNQFTTPKKGKYDVGLKNRSHSRPTPSAQQKPRPRHSNPSKALASAPAAKPANSAITSPGSASPQLQPDQTAERAALAQAAERTMTIAVAALEAKTPPRRVQDDKAQPADSAPQPTATAPPPHKELSVQQPTPEQSEAPAPHPAPKPQPRPHKPVHRLAAKTAPPVAKARQPKVAQQHALHRQKAKSLPHSKPAVTRLVEHQTQPKSQAQKANRPPSPPAAPSPAATKKRVRAFLDRYTQTYQRKELTTLLRLFTPDAVENGKRVRSLIPVYRRNFQRASWIRYRISDLMLRKTANGVEAAGTIRLIEQFGNGPLTQTTGSIRFDLVRAGDDYLIKALSYNLK